MQTRRSDCSVVFTMLLILSHSFSSGRPLIFSLIHFFSSNFSHLSTPLSSHRLDFSHRPLTTPILSLSLGGIFLISTKAGFLATPFALLTISPTDTCDAVNTSVQLPLHHNNHLIICNSRHDIFSNLFHQHIFPKYEKKILEKAR